MGLAFFAAASEEWRAPSRLPRSLGTVQLSSAGSSAEVDKPRQAPPKPTSASSYLNNRPPGEVHNTTSLYPG
eukprot:3432602-Alexandrium_andersonii.AAC.1